MRNHYAFVGLLLSGLASATGAAQSTEHEPSHDEHGSDEPESAHPSVQFEVKCRAVNDFGYVASAHGSLEIGSRSDWNNASVSGSLRLKTKFIDDHAEARDVRVQGTVDIHGQYLFANVISGADDLESVFFAFASDSSYVQSKDGIQYQTSCTDSVVRLPAVADLSLTQKLRFTDLPDGSQRAQVEVQNIGNAAVAGPSGRIRIAGRDVDARLFNAAGDKSSLEPGEQGNLQVDLPAGTLARCGDYPIILDLDHSLQSGQFDPFANDSGRAQTPCLRWNTPITEEVLGGPVNALLAYKSLDSIVNSQQVAREDGNTCSSCHFAGSGRNYSPPAGTITPTQTIGSRTWTGYDGWGNAFSNSSIKPDYLKQAFRRWLDDGGQ